MNSIPFIALSLLLLTCSMTVPTLADERDKNVLGTFQGDPLKRPSEASAAAEFDEGLREYRRVIETRCVLCHSRDRIDEAITQRLPFESVEEIILKRNVVISERERNVLGTFWGNPLKEK